MLSKEENIMRYEILGETLPVVICYLESGEKMVTEGGGMSWMSPNMKMETTSNGGIGKIFGRAFSGEKMFQNVYTAQGGEGMIDHAWGYEPCTMEQVKAYKPETNSVCSGQVLHCPYDFDKTKLVVKEMTDLMTLDLVDKRLVTDQIVLTVGYDIENLTDPDRYRKYKGSVTIDRYGRKVPKHAHGTTNLKRKTSSTMLITDAVMELYDRIVDKNLLIRRINITANKLVDESFSKEEETYEQLDLFTDYTVKEQEQAEEEAVLEREKRMQQTMLTIKKKFGKNAILKGMNLQEGATAKDRNEQIGGHKA